MDTYLPYIAGVLAYMSWSGLWACLVLNILEETYWRTEGDFWPDLWRAVVIMATAGIIMPLAVLLSALDDLIRGLK